MENHSGEVNSTWISIIFWFVLHIFCYWWPSYWRVLQIVKYRPGHFYEIKTAKKKACPVKVWADTILTDSSPELYLMVGSFWEHSVSSQWTHKMSSHCELAVSFLWVCNSHSELTATSAWMVSSSGDLTNSSKQAHCVSWKLTESSQQTHSVSSFCLITVS